MGTRYACDYNEEVNIIRTKDILILEPVKKV